MTTTIHQLELDLATSVATSMEIKYFIDRFFMERLKEENPEFDFFVVSLGTLNEADMIAQFCDEEVAQEYCDIMNEREGLPLQRYDEEDFWDDLPDEAMGEYPITSYSTLDED